MEKDLEQIDLASPLDQDSAEKGIQLCRDALNSTREHVVQKGFKNQQEECRFFKTIKPLIVGNLIFYLNVIHISINKPLGTFKEQNNFHREYIAEMGNYFREHREMYQYYRRNLSYLDVEYFTRKATTAAWYCDSLTSFIDVEFCTARDMVYAQIIGNLKTITYLKREICSKKKKTTKNTDNLSTLKWTGAKVDLVELVYALHSSGIINNGRADLKEIAQAFENIFQTTLGDYYRTFLEIRMRKNNQTKLLDFLKTCIQNKIIEADG